MGLVKFEVEIPDFDNELTISVTLKKDGEVVEENTTSLPDQSQGKRKIARTRSVNNSGGTEAKPARVAGNLMNEDF